MTRLVDLAVEAVRAAGFRRPVTGKWLVRQLERQHALKPRVARAALTFARKAGKLVYLGRTRGWELAP